MKTFIAIGAVHALYLSVLIMGKKRKTLSDAILIVFLFLWFLVLGIVYGSYEWKLPILQATLLNISLLIAPVFYLYAMSLMKGYKKPKRSWLLHFIPYVLSTLYLMYVFLFLPESEIDTLLDTDNFLREFNLFNFFSLLELLAIPFYIILILRLFKEYELKISDFFSNIENRKLQWLKSLVIGVFTVWLVLNGFVYFSTLSEDTSLLYGLSLATIFIFYLGYFGTKQDAIFARISASKEMPPLEDAVEVLQKTMKYEKSVLKDTEIEMYSQRLTEYIEKEKPYLNSDLNLNDLASSIEMSTHNLSQLLNKKFHQTFYDFINSYRVEEFKASIHRGDYKKFTILAIALESGFNSKSSFNRIFKKVTESTPLEYIKSNSLQD